MFNFLITKNLISIVNNPKNKNKIKSKHKNKISNTYPHSLYFIFYNISKILLKCFQVLKKKKVLKVLRQIV